MFLVTNLESFLDSFDDEKIKYDEEYFELLFYPYKICSIHDL